MMADVDKEILALLGGDVERRPTFRVAPIEDESDWLRLRARGVSIVPFCALAKQNRDDAQRS
jgi:hypothetical protein